MAAAEKLDEKISPATQASVLVVDDHPVTADLERAYLASVGFKVFVASSAAQVMKIVRNEQIDLMIIDLQFEKGAGATVLKSAKRSSANADIKVIATSVVGTPATKRAAEEAGSDSFLLKPAPRPKVLKELKALTSLKSRDTERVKKKLLLTYHIKGKLCSAATLDISADGVHLTPSGKSKFMPDVGTEIVLTLPLAENSKALTIDGTVVRHTAEGFGVRFAELGKVAQRQLDKFILTHSLEQKTSKYYL